MLPLPLNPRMVTELMMMGFESSTRASRGDTNRIDDLYSIHDKSEYGVSAIQVSGRFDRKCYEELAAAQQKTQ